jgi:hypothetical protein
LILIADLRVLDTDTLAWSTPKTRGIDPAARHFHTASNISRVMYVFGGYDGEHWRNDTVGLELTTLTWMSISFVGPLPPVRASHSSSVIEGNKMVVFGGYDGDKFLNDLWIMEPGASFRSIHHWSKVDIKPQLNEVDIWPRPRSGHTATTIRNIDGTNNIILLFGGRHKDGRCNELIYFNAETKEWADPKAVGRLPSARKTHAAAAVEDRLFMLGGHDGDKPLGKHLHILDIKNLIRPHKRELRIVVPPSSFSSDFATILLGGPESLTDITFIVEGKEVRLHKAVLAARCEYFRKMFNSGMLESTATHITLYELRHDVFLALSDYLYTDQLQDPTFALDLLVEAEKMNIPRLSALCQSVLEEGIDAETVTNILDAADTYMAHALRKVCVAYILENWEQVSVTEGFVGLRVDLLREILRKRANPGSYPSPPHYIYQEESYEPLTTLEAAPVTGGGSSIPWVNGGGDRSSGGSNRRNVVVAGEGSLSHQSSGSSNIPMTASVLNRSKKRPLGALDSSSHDPESPRRVEGPSHMYVSAPSNRNKRQRSDDQEEIPDGAYIRMSESKEVEREEEEEEEKEKVQEVVEGNVGDGAGVKVEGETNANIEEGERTSRSAPHVSAPTKESEDGDH